MTRKDKDFEILGRERVYDGFFKLDAYTLRQRLPSGGWSPPYRREVFERGHSVAALPYDPGRDVVVLIEQFRAPAAIAGRPAFLIEVVAGMRGPGEDAESCALREVTEETGCRAFDPIPIYDYLVSPGGSTETMAVFVVRVDSREARAVAGDAATHEYVAVRPLPWAKAAERLATGRLDNAVTIVALQWLAMNRDRLRRAWPPPSPPR